MSDSRHNKRRGCRDVCCRPAISYAERILAQVEREQLADDPTPLPDDDVPRFDASWPWADYEWDAFNEWDG